MSDLLLWKKNEKVLRNTLSGYDVLELVTKPIVLDQAQCLVMKSEQLSVLVFSSKPLQSCTRNQKMIRDRKENKTLHIGYVK